MAVFRIFIIGRWGHGPEAVDFYHWLAMALGQGGPPPVDELQVPMMPGADAPDVDTWVNAIHQMVGPDPAERARTLLVGHSVGAMACVRYAATLPPETPIAGLLAVGAWWSIDAPLEGLAPWIEAPLDLAAARANLPKVLALLGDDDPYTSDVEGNAARWRERLGAEVRVVPGAAHFNDPVQPAVLRGLQDLLGMP